jgi:hypothetical protein
MRSDRAIAEGKCIKRDGRMETQSSRRTYWNVSINGGNRELILMDIEVK